MLRFDETGYPHRVPAKSKPMGWRAWAICIVLGGGSQVLMWLDYIGY